MPQASKNLFYYKVKDHNRNLTSAEEAAEEFATNKLNPENAEKMEKML